MKMDRLRACMIMPADFRRQLPRETNSKIIDLIVKAVELERRRVTALVNDPAATPTTSA